MRVAIVKFKSFAYAGPLDWTRLAHGITIPITYPRAQKGWTAPKH